MKGGIDVGRSLLFFAVALAVSFILSATMNVSPSAPPSSNTTAAPFDAERLEHEIFLAMNECRIKCGLPPLEYDQRLAALAREHSIDMAERNYYSHTTPEGVTFEMRLRQAGYSLSGHHYGETIIGGEGYFQVTDYEAVAEEVVQGWYNSPGHRKIMLSPDLKRVGIGVALSDAELYVTADYSD